MNIIFTESHSYPASHKSLNRALTKSHGRVVLIVTVRFSSVTFKPASINLC